MMTGIFSRPWLNKKLIITTRLKSFGFALTMWFTLRIVSSLFISFVSSLRPLTDIERRIALLPPTQPITEWLNRVFLSPWLRWDAFWFTRIVTQGYHADDGTALFHPLYPLLAKPFYLLHVNPVLSLLVISTMASIGLIVSYQYLAAIDLDENDVQFGTLLLFLAPPAFVLFAPYTEGLFLFLAVLCLFSVHRQKWWIAGLTGGLAALTRQQGMLLLIPVAWEMWIATGHDIDKVIKQWKLIFPLGLIPFGYFLWVVYRALILRDFQLNMDNPITLLSSLLLSPSGSNVVEIHGLVWPWVAVKMAVQKIVSPPDVDIWVNVILGFGFLLLLVMTWKRLNWVYRLYALAITLISFSFNTGSIHPYMGLPRHLLLAFPVFICLTPIFNTPWKRYAIIAMNAGGWFFLLFVYGFQTWVP